MPEYVSERLDNGVMLHVMRGGHQPIVKVDISIAAGSLRADRALVASATAELLSEGTRRRGAQEIAEVVDFYGAHTWAESSAAQMSFAAVSLEKDLRAVVDIVSEVLREPAFPEREVELYKAQELQTFDMKMMRTPFLASRALLELLYAPGRYSRYARREDYGALCPEVLREFHAKAYRPNGTHIFVSGRPKDEDVEYIAKVFGGSDWEQGEAWEAPGPEYNEGAGRRMIEYDSEQTSVKMARGTFTRGHRDNLPLQMANAAFGGYFGSRLMQNVRERLGLTYGIYSVATANRSRGTHTITSEVKAGSHGRVVEEIFREMERMGSSLLSDKEMETLRGYMMGEVLHYFETIMTSADTVFSLLLDGVTEGYIRDLFEVARDITASEVRDVAGRWFRPEEYSVVCVGRGVGD